MTEAGTSAETEVAPEKKTKRKPPPPPAPGKDLYQKLYESPTLNYGSAEHDRCPGVRLLEKFQPYLKGVIIDVGCGRGDLVRKLRELGFEAAGVDWVELDNKMMVADIREPDAFPDGFDTAICCDVLEHLDEAGIDAVIANLARCERQVISVAWFPTKEPGFDEELHVTQRDGGWWSAKLGEKLTIHDCVTTADQRALFLCSTKTEG